jgi:hypothetical protein
MALRLLAGPIALRGPKGEKGNFRMQCWWPNNGLMVFGWYYLDLATLRQATYGLHRATLDGVCEVFSGYNSTSYVFSWWPARGRLLSTLGYKEYQIEPVAGVTQWCGPNDPLWPEDQPYWQAITYTKYAKLFDRRIYYSNDYIRRAIPGMEDEPEGPLFPRTPGGVSFQGSVCAGRSDTDVCVAGSSGAIFYNTVNQKIASRQYWPGVVSGDVVYVPEWEVFISAYFEDLQDSKHYGQENCIRIWSMETEPTVLSEPVPFIGTPKSGQVVTYRVRLTGDAVGYDQPLDPAEGELVNWELEGAGTLLDLQTKTDAEGYATARVQYALGETGDSTVGAWVSC